MSSLRALGADHRLGQRAELVLEVGIGHRPLERPDGVLDEDVLAPTVLQDRGHVRGGLADRIVHGRDDLAAQRRHVLAAHDRVVVFRLARAAEEEPRARSRGRR